MITIDCQTKELSNENRIFPTIRATKNSLVSCDKNLFKFLILYLKKNEFKIIYSETEIKDIDFWSFLEEMMF